MTWAYLPDNVIEGLPKMKPATAKVCMALASFMNGSGECWPSRAALAERSGIQRIETISAALCELELLGLIKMRSRRRTSKVFRWTQDIAKSARSKVQDVAKSAMSKNQDIAESVCQDVAESVCLDIAESATGKNTMKNTTEVRVNSPTQVSNSDTENDATTDGETDDPLADLIGKVIHWGTGARHKLQEAADAIRAAHPSGNGELLAAIRAACRPGLKAWDVPKAVDLWLREEARRRPTMPAGSRPAGNLGTAGERRAALREAFRQGGVRI